MILYTVTNWNQRFENNRTRELKKLDWIPVPNKHDGDGFTDLIGRKDGVALFGAWNLILQVASKCNPRGSLLRDPAGGCGNVRIPHTASSLARMTRCPEPIMQSALSACVEIGWLTSKEFTLSGLQNPAGGCGDPPPPEPHNPAGGCLEGKGMEGNSTDVGKQQSLPLVAPPSEGSKQPSGQSESEWIKELQSDPAYKDINVEREHSKMCRWCLEQKKQPTRRRFINWLNRVDIPLDANATNGQPSVNRNAGTYNENWDIEAAKRKVR